MSERAGSRCASPRRYGARTRTGPGGRTSPISTTTGGSPPRPPTPSDSWTTIRAPIEALSEWLAGRRVLLVLDCCERVLDACWELVTELLDAAPNLTVLATGRQPLGVQGEHCIEVAPLSTGDEEGGSDEAVRLFRERCATDAPDVPLDSPEAAATISRICRRLEGIRC
ncbi:hypothetical protein GCM10009646_89350 [Streptomyces aureus]